MAIREGKAREIFGNFGFREIVLPILEKTELFKRSIGETTDIVEKEMYTFTDRGDESLTMRPEATASIMRAYLEHSLYASETLVKLFTIGPMFRRERPQKGRFRQFNQLNAELLGSKDPRVDAEVILMLVHFLRSVGVADAQLEINSLGCPACRPAFREVIHTYLAGKSERSLRGLPETPFDEPASGLRLQDRGMPGDRLIGTPADRISLRGVPRSLRRGPVEPPAVRHPLHRQCTDGPGP